MMIFNCETTNICFEVSLWNGMDEILDFWICVWILNTFYRVIIKKAFHFLSTLTQERKKANYIFLLPISHTNENSGLLNKSRYHYLHQ